MVSLCQYSYFLDPVMLTFRVSADKVKGLSCMQKGNRQQSASNQQQPNQALQRQASVGGPAGPGTPRVPPPSNHGHRGDLAQDGSFDLGSFLAN